MYGYGIVDPAAALRALGAVTLDTGNAGDDAGAPGAAGARDAAVATLGDAAEPAHESSSPDARSTEQAADEADEDEASTDAREPAERDADDHTRGAQTSPASVPMRRADGCSLSAGSFPDTASLTWLWMLVFLARWPRRTGRHACGDASSAASASREESAPR